MLSLKPTVIQINLIIEQIDVSPFTFTKRWLMSSWPEVGEEEEEKLAHSFCSVGMAQKGWWVCGNHTAPAASRWWRHMLHLPHICICVGWLQFKAAQVLQVWQVLVAPQTDPTHGPDQPAALGLCCVVFWREKRSQKICELCFPPDTKVKWGVCE